MTPEQHARQFVTSIRDLRQGQQRPGVAPLTASPEDRCKAWENEARNARLHLRPWAFHRDWLNYVALEHLPAVCAVVGTGEPELIWSKRPLWWPQDEPGFSIVVLWATPDAGHLLCIDQASGYWAEPSLGLHGVDLIELVERRLNLTTTKAAWRLARICKLRSPMP